MSHRSCTLSLTLCGALTLAPSAIRAQATLYCNDVEGFRSAVSLGATQAAGTWYTDRYAPNGSITRTSFGANDRLPHHIDTADCDGCRGAQHGDCYNTRGRKCDLGTGATEMETQPHVPAAWTTTGRRMVGFWGSADLLGFHVVPPFVDAPLTIVRD
jgi:hypothetical protein